MSTTNRILTALGAVLLIGACGSGEPEAAVDTEELSRELLSQPVGDGRSTPVAADESLTDAAPQVSVSELGIDHGSVEAPVKVLELSDYGCGYCRQFHQETFPALRRDFIESGMVEWKFVPFITGMFDNSLDVTEAAECVYAQDEGAFELLNGRLWDEQAAWKRSDQPSGVVRDWVDDLEIDMGAFDTCMAEDERLGRVASSTALARQVGVRGTPTFLVIGYPPLQGALPLDTFSRVLSAVYQQAVSGPSGEGPTGQQQDR